MEQKRQQFEDISAAVDHLESSVSAGSIAAGAAKGILYGLFEAVGTIIGDPDLPEHIVYSMLDNLELIDHIDRVGVVFYDKT